MAGDFNIWVDVPEDPKTKQFFRVTIQGGPERMQRL